MKKITSLTLVLLLFVITVVAQTRSVTGTVTDEKNAPVAGASVVIIGTSKGTVTGADGSFTLQVATTVKKLTISSLNYATQDVAIADHITVVLKSAATSLTEVVVVAYGQVKKASLTGSVATIKAADIEDKPFSSVDKALQGAVAGLQSSSASGIPGSATDIRIRGIGSINASASPLWVIDGMVATSGDLTVNTTSANALSSLNPDDIESISVLKDAAASAIYGSRAANGVIIVTTKSGKAGKTKITFTTEVGANKIARLSDNNRPMTTLENQQILRESLINAGYATDNADADALIIDPTNGLGFDPNWLQTNTDWLDQVTRTGKQQQYNLSMSGGNDKTQYYASAGYFNQDGTTIATYFKRYNGSLSVQTKVNDKVTFKVGINGSTSTQLSPPGSAAYASPVSGSFFLQPWFSPYNADGSYRYNDPQGQFTAGSQFNPVVLAAWNKSTANQIQMRGYVSGDYQILPNLKFTSRYSGEYFNVNEYDYWNPFYGDGSSTQGLGQANNKQIFDWTWTNQFNYRVNLNQDKDFYLDLLAGTEAYAINNKVLQTSGQNFPSTIDLTYLASAAKPVSAATNLISSSVTSYLSSGVLNYKNRYALSASFRRDGSSVFSKDNKWGNFYSVGGTWNISEEDFFKNLSTPINQLKLRSSYGQNGNTNGFGYYAALPTYGFGSAYLGAAGSAPNNVGNPDLTWEKNNAFNIGLDFAVWKNRFNGTIEYYKRTSTDLLINVPLSPTSGFSGGQLMNVGSMYNKGLELTLGGRPIATKNFTWDVSFNISHNTNRVTKLYNHAPISQQTRFNITEGHDIFEFYTRLWAGVDSKNGDPLWYTDATRTTTTNDATKATLSLTGKSASPKYFGSFTNKFAYKAFSLEGQFYYNFGNYIYDTWENYLLSDGAYVGGMNQLSLELTSWKNPGDITNVPKIVYGGNQQSNRPSTRYLYKGDYIRLRNLQLGYTVPKNLLAKAHIASLEIYGRGTNLFTFGADKNLPTDPELGASSIGDFQVFMPKSFTVGIKLGL